MKLLIITQAVDINNPLLGFFNYWIEEFSRHCEQVTVIALGVGEYKLSQNVKILSLGKEDCVCNSWHPHIIRKFLFLYRFYKYIWQERKNYDAVFVHMNPIYVVFGGIFWKAQKKKIGLWYTHRIIDWKLKLAEKIADIIFTASKESFVLDSKKLKILGHGIDINKFKKQEPGSGNGLFNIVYVGRISGIKNQKLLIGALNVLVNKRGIKNIRIDFVGSATYERDRVYLSELKQSTTSFNLNDYVNFIGSVPYKEIVDVYNRADLSVNLCLTGGLDKAVLESMACELPVLATNAGFKEEFGSYADNLLVEENDPMDLADKINDIINKNKGELLQVGKFLRQQVAIRHDLHGLIKNMVELLH